ncbi:MAG: hypothetical protein AAB545_01155 [Patescibacteria group bacterium]
MLHRRISSVLAYGLVAGMTALCLYSVSALNNSVEAMDQKIEAGNATLANPNYR